MDLGGGIKDKLCIKEAVNFCLQCDGAAIDLYTCMPFQTPTSVLWTMEDVDVIQG